MRNYLVAGLLSLVLVAPANAAIFPTLDGNDPLIWAHRGASVFSRENTLEAFELAQAENADGTELDLVLTADGDLAVFHDTTLDNLTNVEDVFPDSRRRADGRYHVADFTMAELRTLEVDPSRLERYAPLLPDGVRVAESGLKSAADARRMADAGYRLALVGTALMRSADPGALIREMAGAA